MADESKVETRPNPIPATLADDHEDVSWALSTAKTTWDRGEHSDALKWLRRAAEAASEIDADDRALTLAKAAADLTTQIDELAWDIGSTVRPPADAAGQLPAGMPKTTVRLSPLVPPAPPPSAQFATRPAGPLAPPAPSPRALRPSPPASNAASAKAIPAPRPTHPTGAALLSGGTTPKTTRPKHPSLGLLGPRPLGPRPRPAEAAPPPLPARASRPPVASRPPTPPPPQATAQRPDVPDVIEAISSRNLLSVTSLPASGSPRADEEPPPPETPNVTLPERGRNSSGPAATSEVSQVVMSQSSDRERTTRPAGAWDDAQDDSMFSPTPAYPSGPESLTFAPAPLDSATRRPADPHDSGTGRVAPSAGMPSALETRPLMPTPAAPPPSSANENPSRETASVDDMESWPVEAAPGTTLPNFSFDDATKTRIGTPIYREQALSSSASAEEEPTGETAALPRAYAAESRIAARGPVQKPSQAVRVIVWRGPDGVHVAPHGTTVTAISVDALLVALDPSADLFAWLTNK